MTGVAKDHGLTSAEKRKVPVEVDMDLAVAVQPLTSVARKKKLIVKHEVPAMAEVDPGGGFGCGTNKVISISARQY